MRNKTLFILLITFYTTNVFAQQTENAFEKFANRQDSLFVAAYKQKDIAGYHHLLSEFLVKYNDLKTDDKRRYSGYLNGAYYNLCCTYSLAGDKAGALKYFDEAIKAGYLDYAHINEDSDLDPIRNEKEFKEKLALLRSVGDYMFILKKASRYNDADNRPVPEFTYQSADNQNLKALRKAFKLDSIAGQGSDVLKMINLLDWVHYLIPHDGMHGIPEVRNAMNMIAECKREGKGLNCRGLATVLNECYLSLGMKSRIVTCFPKDSLKTDNDCHVINMVYSDTLRKWLWMDPTNDAYVMNEKGELLGIDEVRDRLINDKPLLLNPNANWNRQTITKDFYLYHYMAKNLYMPECPLDSEYDMETKVEGKKHAYVRLLPLEYFAQSPDVIEEKGEKKNTSWKTYQTNNPKLFWAAPERKK